MGKGGSNISWLCRHQNNRTLGILLHWPKSIIFQPWSSLLVRFLKTRCWQQSSSVSFKIFSSLMVYDWACPKRLEYRQMIYEEPKHPFIGHISGVRRKKGHFDFSLIVSSDSAYNVGEKIVLATHCPPSIRNIHLINSLTFMFWFWNGKKKQPDFNTCVNSSALTRQLF